MKDQVKKDAAPKFTELNEICCEGSGGKILFATDDWFAPAEMMIKDSDPIFITDKYTEYGKWMDGWETQRKRIAGHDWCVIKLGAPTVIRGVDLDTAFFTGNYVPRFSIQAANLTPEEESLIPERCGQMGSFCTPEDVKQVSRLNENWSEIVPMSELRPGYEDTRHNYFSIDCEESWTHLRLNMYPDGGIARIRVFGEVKPDMSAMDLSTPMDLLSIQNGGLCLGYSNAHYGHPRNLIKSGKGVNMGDGWETARRLDRPAILESDPNGILLVPGNEWAIFRLCSAGTVSHIMVDTNHFRGNFPDSVRVEGALLSTNRENNARSMNLVEWKTVLNSSKLRPHSEHDYFENDLVNQGPFSHVRVTMAPDGGISRVRMFGNLVSVPE